MTTSYQSWGGVPSAAGQQVRHIFWADQLAPALATLPGPVLPRGLGRSQGDSCLNNGGWLLDTTGLDRVLLFDRLAGRLRCEAGVTLDALLRLIVPAGWFLPVTPGTRQVTIGGAIANDVHGKNHHRAGSFGRHVLRLELVRSDGSRLLCSPSEQPELFAATIGGLGLTGVISWAEIRLEKIASAYLMAETIRCSGLAELLAVGEASLATHQYVVGWVDCFARGSALGRGALLRGNGASAGELMAHSTSGRRWPLPGPALLVSPLFMRSGSWLTYHARYARAGQRAVHYAPFFYPLDSVHDWNRVYGRRGFYQYQCVLPPAAAPAALAEMLEMIATSRRASFLSTVKFFGTLPSPGLLAFPRPGVALAVDFANVGQPVLTLFDRLDRIVQAAGGALYPAKDGRMSGEVFRASFPRWQEFTPHIDPKLSSSFWRRVMD